MWHYLYAWSGENRWLGAIVPVNESVWEHLKLGYWPLVLFSLVEYPYVKPLARNYFFAKLAGILALELCILAIHYTYTSLSGHLHLGIDIASFVLGVALCQYVVYRIYRTGVHQKKREAIALSSFIALGALFLITTYHPLPYELFRDKNTNSIGIGKIPVP